MSIAERIAVQFHETYEELAPDFGYETREASAVAWEDVPEVNRKLMVATVQRLLDTGVIDPGVLTIEAHFREVRRRFMRAGI